MSKSFALFVALMAMAIAGQALALNPQPLPPLLISPPVHGGHAPLPHAPPVRF
jgi:hypothetical protein